MNGAEHYERVGTALAEDRKRLRAALVEAGFVLEVLGIEITRQPYREMTADFQAAIISARDAVRAAL